MQHLLTSRCGTTSRIDRITSLPGEDVSLGLDETRRLERTLYKLSDVLCRGLSREQQARFQEWKEKEHLAVRDAFGERVRDMLRVDTLATRPGKRHQGYGSALLAAANIRADELALASWLSTSNPRCATLLEHLGFATVKDYLVGEANPNWLGPPVVVRIMLREPRRIPTEGHS
ncbi:hypothetical protein DAEQUDRAFT_504946 [Daedalea quercina L-15889]|uniref:N-acetyltransferase domain-containing protein n=1 Tax=Daedalea quercina L-15889 TaxID=1314783 RepID=A0A165T7Y5_9APHY|nr:hypothetical protein DAEQUDRAFT_504946 [Daedalea quercina L-15889]